ncbi:uncharacterized protein LOC116197848 [Punica granatum]|uniref:DUF506 domain-containing protein n=2 Tax=Punica granatum TaxID=22663 RepID=A0A218WGZ7_PUNGR|nr:uncharacterized protein LOC116197848 [Punica granatum]OWM71620.1 hypothetical protein CDL15_Pgr005807 [Punica granatum]PKI32627.1 hypothetical protein CRG98_046974 [Punica granatum]
MPPMKIQPIGFDPRSRQEPFRANSAKPAPKSRLKRLFDRPFPSVLRISSAAEKPVVDTQISTDGEIFEPSSVCLAKMVQNFIEDSNEKQSAAKCVRNRCNCFNGNGNDSSDDEFDGFGEPAGLGSSGDACDALKGLVPCATVAERNLLADTATIVEKNKSLKRKDDLRKIVTESLSSLGYDSSICKSKWDKSSSFPAGEYEYIDVIVQGERLLIDVDFRSEFEIARSTGAYRAILQSLPYIFVGKADRLSQIVRIVSEAAKQNLKKKGMHIPPWRKAEYMQAKWLSSYTRAAAATAFVGVSEPRSAETRPGEDSSEGDGGDFELIFGKETPTVSPSEPGDGKRNSPEWVDVAIVVQTWQPPAVKPKGVEKGARVVPGLASLLRERP